MKIDDISRGKYQHYKTGKLYEVIDFACYSETHEEMIIYRALHHCTQFSNNQIRVRPKKMFIEDVSYNEYQAQRFKRIDE